MSPVLLDAHELAERIGYSEDHILRWARMGIILRVKTSHRVYFNLDRVVEAIRDRQRGMSGQPPTADLVGA